LVRKIVVLRTMRLKLFWVFLTAGLLTGLMLGAQSQEQAPKPQQSAITIKVFKSGLFSGFAHNHVVVAPVSHAAIDPAHLMAEITVVTKEMKVTDPDVSEKDRAEIQSTMLGPKVLDQEKYPEIHFKSSSIKQTSPQHYSVAGTLELHGAKQEITFEVVGEARDGAAEHYHGTAEHYHGATKLKQSDFGIKPISLGGGSIKVKDELELEFDVYASAAAAAQKK
jgi:polyisoprenoid-binding protein YceI